jgi:hypothetical protein
MYIMYIYYILKYLYIATAGNELREFSRGARKDTCITHTHTLSLSLSLSLSLTHSHPHTHTHIVTASNEM